MPSSKELLESFRGKSKWPETPPPHELYFSLGPAIEVVAACEDSGLAILGLDGIVFDGKSKRAPIDMILDCSTGRPGTSQGWHEFRDTSNRSARHFLQTHLAEQQEQMTSGEEILVAIDVVSQEDMEKSHRRRAAEPPPSVA